MWSFSCVYKKVHATILSLTCFNLISALFSLQRFPCSTQVSRVGRRPSLRQGQVPRLCCRRAILLCSNDGAASIRKFGLEIKNRCTQEGLNREKLASIPKSRPEIKNRCTLECLIGENLASILKSGLKIKNRCTQEGLNGENRAGHPQHAFIRGVAPEVSRRYFA